jgi:hypothetical protein
VDRRQRLPKVYRQRDHDEITQWFPWSKLLQRRLSQQYLAKNPDGYCGIGGCGVPFKSAELQTGEKA